MHGPLVRLKGQQTRAVIAGGEPRALPVIETLCQAQARVRLFCKSPSPAVAALASRAALAWHSRALADADIAEATLVVAADANPAANRALAERAARQHRLFYNVCTGEGDIELIDPARLAAPRDDLWQHAQVCLVGAGPGDPGLITVDGRQALAGADIVLYDRLVAPALLELAPPTAERRFVGKRRDHHHMRQPDLNTLMIDLARQGRRVVRLKGGDPFVFGRGGEELIDLAQAGVATRVIPGITAGSGCATYADIPLTHRGLAASCQFLTAHGRDGELDHDWTSLVRGGHTLVVYMGVMALANLCPALMRHGMQSDTPAALIERGTLPEQRVLTGTVASLPGIAARHTVTSPAVLIVGDVVSLRATIHAARDRADPLMRRHCVADSPHGR